MQLRSMQYRLPSASGINDPKCVPHVESTSPVVVSTVTLVLFTLIKREERSTKHEERSTKHKARSTKHEAQSTKHKAQSKAKIPCLQSLHPHVSTRMEFSLHCNHRHGGTHCIIGQQDRGVGVVLAKGECA